jgi:hypothetical protein
MFIINLSHNLFLKNSKSTLTTTASSATNGRLMRHGKENRRFVLPLKRRHLSSCLRIDDKKPALRRMLTNHRHVGALIAALVAAGFPTRLLPGNGEMEVTKAAGNLGL